MTDSKPSEIEYRAARELWHLEMAVAARSPEAAERHTEIARRYADYGEAVVDIDASSTMEDLSALTG